MQEVLEHDAVAAGARVRAHLLRHLCHRTDERAVGVALEPIVEAGVARCAAVELARSLQRVGLSRADQAAAHGGEPHRCWIAAGALARGDDLRADRRELVRRDERAVVLVGEARRRVGGAAQTLAADEERRMRLLHRLGQAGSVVEDVVAAAEVDAVLRPEPVHDLQLLREHLDAHARLREREAERAVLPFHPAGAEPELDAAARDVVGRGGRVREQRGQAEGGGRDERPEPQRGRPAASAASVVQASCATFARLVRHRDVVVAAKERLDAVLLAGVRKRAPLRPGDAFLPLDHQRDPHRSIVVARFGPSGRRRLHRRRRRWPRIPGESVNTSGNGSERPWEQSQTPIGVAAALKRACHEGDAAFDAGQAGPATGDRRSSRPAPARGVRIGGARSCDELELGDGVRRSHGRRRGHRRGRLCRRQDEPVQIQL